MCFYSTYYLMSLVFCTSRLLVYQYTDTTVAHWSSKRNNGIFSGTHVEELIETLRILEFSVAVEKQCGVILTGQALFMQFLQISRQLVDTLSIQELSFSFQE